MDSASHLRPTSIECDTSMEMENDLIEMDIEAKEIVQVPVELIAHALSFLKPQELANTSRVCKSWNDISKDITVWKHHAKRFGREEASPIDGKKFVKALQEIKSAYPEVVKAALGGAEVIANLPILELDSFRADLTAQDITSKIMRGKVGDNHFLLFSYKLTVIDMMKTGKTRTSSFSIADDTKSPRTQFAACILVVSKAEDIGFVDIFDRACDPLYICDQEGFRSYTDGLRSYTDCYGLILQLLEVGKSIRGGNDLQTFRKEGKSIWDNGYHEFFEERTKIKMVLELCDPQLTILDRRIVSRPSDIWELITKKIIEKFPLKEHLFG